MSSPSAEAAPEHAVVVVCRHRRHGNAVAEPAMLLLTAQVSSVPAVSASDRVEAALAGGV